MKAGAIVGGLILGGYHFSEKIGHIQHNVQEELKDTLGKKEILKDQETNDIIKLMSGKISQKEFDALLARHGYENDTINIKKVIEPDDALYKAILEIQTKYTNPKITLSRDLLDYIIIKDNQRAHFSAFQNKIFLHNMDSVMLNFRSIADKEKFDRDHIVSKYFFQTQTWQNYLLNSRVAEISHAKQLQEKGAMKWNIDGGRDFIATGFDYDKTYHTKGMQEYQAHTEYEPKIIEEFIHTYEKYTDIHNIKQIFTLAKLYGGFFDNFKNEEKMISYLKILEKKGDGESTYLLGKYYFQIYCKSFDRETMDTVNIQGKLYTSEEFLNKVLSCYQKAYKLGNLTAGKELIDIAFNCRGREHNDLIIQVGEDILSKNKEKLDTSGLGSIYQTLGSIYYIKGDSVKGKEYYLLSRKYGEVRDYF